MAKTSAKQQASHNFDALFGARQGERIVSGGFKMLSHDRITVRPQVRRTFPPAEMDELRGSIRELRAQKSGIEGSGVLQALLVAPEGENYRLIAGEKRFRATQAEGLPEVPCVIIPAVSEGMTRLLQLTENALRSAPPVLEEAQAMRETLEEQKLSLRDLARLMGKTLGYVTNRLNLLKMSPDVRDMVSRRSNTLKHAPLIEGVEDQALRAELIRAVVEDELSVKELERSIRPDHRGDPVASPSGEQERNTEDRPAPSPPLSGSLPASQPASTPKDQAGQVFSRENTPGDDQPLSDAHKQRPASPHPTVSDNKKLPAREAAMPQLNPITGALQPARELVARAEQLLEQLALSPDDRAQVRQEVKQLAAQIARIQKIIA